MQYFNVYGSTGWSLCVKRIRGSPMGFEVKLLRAEYYIVVSSFGYVSSRRWTIVALTKGVCVSCRSKVERVILS